MKQPDIYLNLRSQVYEMSRSSPPKDEYAFYRNYVKNAKGSVLEPMCGSGRFLLPLCAEGFDVQGFDASKHMLEILQSKALHQDIKPNVWFGLIEQLSVNTSYKLIYIPSSSICLITDIQMLQETIHKLFNHLNDGGILLFESDTSNAIPQPDIWKSSTWHKTDSEMIILSQLIKLHEHGYHSFSKYELVKNGKVISTELEELKVQIYSSEELLTVLKNCGFRKLRVVKAFNSAMSPNEGDKTIIYECQK